MKQPEGYHDGLGCVCKLQRSLYGLKQASGCWKARFVDFMKTQGFKCSTADPCLFIRQRDGKKHIVVIYVDDGLIAESDDQEIDEFLRKLSHEFKIKVGSLDNFLGMKIEK